MIDLASESVLSLVSAAASLPVVRGDRPPCVKTLKRWASAGIRGVRLETIRVGGSVCTSAEALQRFCDALEGRPAEHRGPAAQSKHSVRVARELDRLGI